MWLLPLLFLTAPDCPPCVCEMSCRSGVPDYDATALVLQVQRLEYEVSVLQVQAAEWEQVTSEQHARYHEHAILKKRLKRWRWYADGPGVPLVLGGDIDEDGDDDGDLEDLALAMRTGGEW